MEAALMSAAELICKLTVPPLAKKVNSIWNNEKQIEELGGTVDLIRDVLYDVEGKQFQEASMKKCYKRLRNAFLDAKDFLDRVQTLKKKKDLEARMLKEEKEEIINKANGKLKRSVGVVGIKIKPLKKKALRFFYKKNQATNVLEVNNTIKKVRKKLDAIAEDMHKFGPKGPSNSLVATHMTARASGPYVNPTNVIGRDEDKRKIVDLLLRSSVDEQKIPVVSIVAPGGTGKTTIAQLVYNDKSWQDTCQFEHRLWVSNSKKLDLKALLKHILKSICPNETGLSDLEEDHLRQQIVDKIHGKRFLLILDDVENEDPLSWDNLKGLLDCGSNDSRILVTTRSIQVAKVVGSYESTHRLTCLSKEDSLQLFESYAFRGAWDERFIEIGNIIVEKCCGVPLAIKVVGSLLRDEGKHKWEYFRDNSLTEKTDEGNQIMDILKLSYTNLDPTLQRTGKGETVEDACDKSLRILYNRCFLELDEMKKRNHDDTHLITHDEWDDVECFKLHDLMHDLVKEVAGAEIVVVDSDERSIEENVRHVTLGYKTRIFEPKGRRVRSFILERWYYSRLSFDKIVLGCPVLRYLDVQFIRSENLTGSIGKLIHFRYLCLSRNGFKTLPHSIAEYINLRKLELASCWELTHLPSEMGALTSLEVLDLSYCYKLEKLPGGIEKLLKLKKLLLRGCHKLTHLPHGMGALTSLEVLDLSSCHIVELPGGIEKLMKLRKLLLAEWRELTHLPPGMGALTSLEVLDLSFCSELKELPRGMEKLLNLKNLLLEGCLKLARMPAGMGALLGVCEPARFIVGGDEGESNHTAQLEELGRLADLPAKLVIELPVKRMTWKEGGDGDETFAILLNKTSLRKLEIEWWCLLHVIEDVEEKVGRHQMEMLGKLQPPTGLEDLTLRQYQWLAFPRWMPRDGFASVLPNLASLSLEHCQGFRYLPPLSGLDRLRALNLIGLSSLEYIIEEEEESDSEATYCLPQLESLELNTLPKFKGWCIGEDTNELVVLSSLSRIDTRDCPSLSAPFRPFVLKAFDLSSPSSSFDYLFDQVCKNDGAFELSKGMEDSLTLRIERGEFTEKASSSYMEEGFRGASHRLTHLEFIRCSGLKTLPGLHHLTALRELRINYCDDFTWEEEDAEEG